MKSVINSACYKLLFIPLASLLSFNCTNQSSAFQQHSVAPKATINQLLTEKQYNELFPQHASIYTYTAFTKAVQQLGQIKIKIIRRAVSVYQFTRTDRSTGKSAIVRQDKDWNEAWAKQKSDSIYYIDFGQFCSERDVQTNKKELAAFFAHIAHETRNGENGKFNDGLMLTHENNTSLPYIAENDVYPPAPGQKYYGRGPMQLSYNGNYGYASDCILGDKNILLKNPNLVETDPVLAFETAIYFWMTPQTYKPSAHDVMIGKWQPKSADKIKKRVPGFGMTINIVNGALECNQGENQINMLERIGYYQHFLTKLGVSDTNCACSCGKMEPYK
jgi:hypothetical protein